MNRVIAGLLLVSSVIPVTAAHAQTLLTPGETTRFNLGAGAFTNDIAIDVPADAQQLRIDLDGPANVDVDLALRYGEAFPGRCYGVIKRRSITAGHD